jgi:acetyl-CoA carboxylase carboxyl transferase beta subunit
MEEKEFRPLKERYGLVRHPERIRSSDIIEDIVDNAVSYESPDPSLVAVKGYVDGIRCIVLGQEKKRKGKDSKARGMITSEGYNYVLDILDEAEEHNIPVISFIDTFGGDATMNSEIGGQSFNISDCIRRFCEINTPTVSYVIGEGGSGGALAMQVADKAFMFENALYSVIAPESCARIIFNKRLQAGEKLEDLVEDALEVLQPGAEHLMEIGMVDEVLSESNEGAHTNYENTVNKVRETLVETLNEWVDIDKKTSEKRITNKTVNRLVKERRDKVLNYGKFENPLQTFKRVIGRKFKRVRGEDDSKGKILNVEMGDSYITQLRKEYLENRNITDAKVVLCEKEWDESENKFRVAGGCGMISCDDYEDNFYACPNCGKGELLGAEEHLAKLCDEDTFEEVESDLGLENLIGNARYLSDSYKDKLGKGEKKGFSKDSLVVGTGLIDGKSVAFAISDMDFIGGSFGAVYGEKFKRIVDVAIKEEIPLISICSSGGARMQEGPMSLAQMAKMNMALLDLKNRGIPYISVIAEPTTGGAYASYVTQGDIMIGEKGSLAEFAGPRVVTGAGLEVDKNVVCTNKLFENGFVDYLVNRNELKRTISYYTRLFHDIKHPKERRNSGRINLNFKNE